MSTNKHTNPAYISHVHLKGYKSIIDTEVELHPGLNILIGPNGSGKTNFLEFLERVIIRKLPKDQVEFYLEIVVDNVIKIWEGQVQSPTENPNTNELETYILDKVYDKGEKKPEVKVNHHSHYGTVIFGNEKVHVLLSKFYPNSSIGFSIPSTISGLSQPINLKIKKENLKAKFTDENSSITFVNSFLIRNFYLKTLSLEILNSKNKLIKEVHFLDDLLKNLQLFSPIKDLRLNGGVSFQENGLYYNLNYISFDFLVNDGWLAWNMLSDGTKRLFYLISEVTLNKGICLIEEPEIGVNPNQYRKILAFLKEQSKEKQIIITTHAPKTLDILADDELDRIILTRYEKDLGTKMRHLSKEEQEHAVKFMKEESFFLSDFWTMTSFFDEEEEVA